jgi:hypothetical protein
MGTTMRCGGIYFTNFATDDFVGHEWTHGVTQYEANLIYFMESGALNESFSDIFGETIDLLNAAGLDPPANRWWIGEDVLRGMLAGIRYMYDPAPGRMSDPNTPTPPCGPTPRGGCLSAPKGVVVKHLAGNSARDKLLWKWLKGTSGPLFGDPLDDTAYTVCVYHAGGTPLQLALDVPAGSGWEPNGTGLTYRGDRGADGVKLITPTPGTGNAKVLVKGQGPSLELSTLAFTQPLTLQLVKSDGLEC